MEVLKLSSGTGSIEVVSWDGLQEEIIQGLQNSVQSVDGVTSTVATDEESKPRKVYLSLEIEAQDRSQASERYLACSADLQYASKGISVGVIDALTNIAPR